MKMNIKTKLYIGIGFLAGFVFLLWISGSNFINTLAENSGAIIQDNIRSVTYTQQMEQALNDIYTAQLASVDNRDPQIGNGNDSFREAEQIFKNFLAKQEANVTEAGEQELTDDLRENFERITGSLSSTSASDASGAALINKNFSPAYQRLQIVLTRLTNMNVDAIKRKNEIAQQTAFNVTIYMFAMGGLCTIIGIIMLIRFPGYIVDPIQELTDRIKEIANHNYDQTLDFRTGDEYEELATAFNQMATKLQEYENSNLNRIMDEKKRVETIINHVKDAIIGLDAQDHILFANEKAVKLIGKAEQELVGKYAADVASTNDFFREVYKASAMENNEEKKFVKTANETKHYYAVDVMPVRENEPNGQNQPTSLGNIITLKNVTKFHEHDQAKTNFISVVSHELKTPISSINMSLRLLQDSRVGKLNAEQKELVANIDKDARRMKNTTSDLLDLSKIESGNVDLDTENVAAGELLEYARETMLVQANQKRLNIELKVQNDLPNVQADLQKTVWVLVNLISNAIRYTDAGGTISLQAKSYDNKTFIQFSVIDTGKGITAEDLDRIFDKYYQADGDQIDALGSGLGLAIAKEFITAQGGQIWAESTPGEGSQFYFILAANNH
jgi:PAS domain S-box-containing protein